MRTNRIRTTALAATALVAALSLTACGGDDKAMGTKPAGSAGAATAAATNTDGEATSSDGKGQTDAPEAGTPETQTVPAERKHAGGNGKKPEAAPNTGAAASIPVCSAQNSRVTVSDVRRPINHLLLTVTNTGSKDCATYHAPFLRFDGAQAVYPILDESKPQAVVVLSPGEKAYAGISLSGEPGENELHKSENLGVIMVDKNNKPKGEVTLKLPAETYTDHLGFVTYWQSDMQSALGI
ncbi:DUF4232 domain-containing protein [Streptomyces globisporus]|uniref:DUF4232 domain-containing protein n=1 Tax=Streptomyces albovinaceus subgroup TaxID=1482558 RepID=UPI000A3A1BE4|nr:MULTISPECIES: DUF4232 domain-containing protein [Streptomyces]RDL01156.1 uncharacterized protein DUF4232 [Streptomyces sp. HB202]